MRIPQLKTRIDIIWVAAALIAGAGGVALATAASSAGDHSAARAAHLQIMAIGDPALASTDPGDDHEAARLAYATGIAASDAAAPQTWMVGAGSVLGYNASGGRFCFEFRTLAGGCLEPGALTDARPIDLTIDYGPGTFHVYGLALDGVTAVSVSVGGRSRPAAFAHNSFYFSDAALGGTRGLAGKVVATMSDGTTREAPFRIDAVPQAPASP